MSQFRYNVALSVLFDNEIIHDGKGGFPDSIMEMPEGRERLEMYARLRREIREMIFRSPDIPKVVEQRLRLQLMYTRYKTSKVTSEEPSFKLITIGRKIIRRIGKRAL